MKSLRMKPEYIDWTLKGTKLATTRLKPKELGEYQLISGSYYKPVKSGCEIEVYAQIKWNFDAPDWFIRDVAIDEGFTDEHEFVDVLEKINPEVNIREVDWYTHHYHVIKRPTGKEATKE